MAYEYQSAKPAMDAMEAGRPFSWLKKPDLVQAGVYLKFSQDYFQRYVMPAPRAPSMRRFVFVIDPSGEEVSAIAASEKEAYRKAWESLSDVQQNACAGLECVDEMPA